MSVSRPPLFVVMEHQFVLPSAAIYSSKSCRRFTRATRALPAEMARRNKVEKLLKNLHISHYDGMARIGNETWQRKVIIKPRLSSFGGRRGEMETNSKSTTLG